MASKQLSNQRLQRQFDAIEQPDAKQIVIRLEQIVAKLKHLAETGEIDRFRHGLSFLSGECSLEWERMRPKPGKANE